MLLVKSIFLYQYSTFDAVPWGDVALSVPTIPWMMVFVELSCLSWLYPAVKFHKLLVNSSNVFSTALQCKLLYKWIQSNCDSFEGIVFEVCVWDLFCPQWVPLSCFISWFSPTNYPACILCYILIKSIKSLYFLSSITSTVLRASISFELFYALLQRESVLLGRPDELSVLWSAFLSGKSLEVCSWGWKQWQISLWVIIL